LGQDHNYGYVVETVEAAVVVIDSPEVQGVVIRDAVAVAVGNLTIQIHITILKYMSFIGPFKKTFHQMVKKIAL
jgi:hypothetical protein